MCLINEKQKLMKNLQRNVKKNHNILLSDANARAWVDVAMSLGPTRFKSQYGKSMISRGIVDCTYELVFKEIVESKLWRVLE
jgi:hypothetical protein